MPKPKPLCLTNHQGQLYNMPLSLSDLGMRSQPRIPHGLKIYGFRFWFFLRQTLSSTDRLLWTPHQPKQETDSQFAQCWSQFPFISKTIAELNLLNLAAGVSEAFSESLRRSPLLVSFNPSVRYLHTLRIHKVYSHTLHTLEDRRKDLQLVSSILFTRITCWLGPFVIGWLGKYNYLLYSSLCRSETILKEFWTQETRRLPRQPWISRGWPGLRRYLFFILCPELLGIFPDLQRRRVK